MTRQILLPTELEKRLSESTYFRDETIGIMPYQRHFEGQDEICPLEGMFMTGVGTEDNVKARSERMKVARRFFKENKGHRCVNFHIHTQFGIDKHGPKYAIKFSKGDDRIYQRGIEKDPAFILMIVTPEAILTKGIDDLEVYIVPDNPEFQNRRLQFAEKIRDIARNLGYDLH